MRTYYSEILFAGLNQEPITMFRYDGGMAIAKAPPTAALAGLVLPEDRGRVLAVAAETSKGIAIPDGDQFLVFQLSNSLDGPTILDSTEVQPSIEGSTESPDVLVSVEMLSFHVAQSEEIDKDTRATLRMDIGKDESSTDKRFDTVF
jgi:hypothetical protein